MLGEPVVQDLGLQISLVGAATLVILDHDMLNLLGGEHRAPGQARAVLAHPLLAGLADEAHTQGVGALIELPPGVGVAGEVTAVLPDVGGRCHARPRLGIGGGEQARGAEGGVGGLDVPLAHARRVADGGDVVEARALQNHVGVHGELADELVVQEHVGHGVGVEALVPVGHVHGGEATVVGEHVLELLALARVPLADVGKGRQALVIGEHVAETLDLARVEAGAVEVLQVVVAAVLGQLAERDVAQGEGQAGLAVVDRAGVEAEVVGGRGARRARHGEGGAAVRERCGRVGEPDGPQHGTAAAVGRVGIDLEAELAAGVGAGHGVVHADEVGLARSEGHGGIEGFPAAGGGDGDLLAGHHGNAGHLGAPGAHVLLRGRELLPQRGGRGRGARGVLHIGEPGLAVSGQLDLALGLDVNHVAQVHDAQPGQLRIDLAHGHQVAVVGAQGQRALGLDHDVVGVDHVLGVEAPPHALVPAAHGIAEAAAQVGGVPLIDAAAGRGPAAQAAAGGVHGIVGLQARGVVPPGGAGHGILQHPAAVGGFVVGGGVLEVGRHAQDVIVVQGDHLEGAHVGQHVGHVGTGLHVPVPEVQLLELGGVLEGLLPVVDLGGVPAEDVVQLDDAGVGEGALEVDEARRVPRAEGAQVAQLVVVAEDVLEGRDGGHVPAAHVGDGGQGLGCGDRGAGAGGRGGLLERGDDGGVGAREEVLEALDVGRVDVEALAVEVDHVLVAGEPALHDGAARAGERVLGLHAGGAHGALLGHDVQHLVLLDDDLVGVGVVEPGQAVGDLGHHGGRGAVVDADGEGALRGHDGGAAGGRDVHVGEGPPDAGVGGPAAAATGAVPGVGLVAQALAGGGIDALQVVAVAEPGAGQRGLAHPHAVGGRARADALDVGSGEDGVVGHLDLGERDVAVQHVGDGTRGVHLVAGDVDFLEQVHAGVGAAHLGDVVHVPEVDAGGRQVDDAIHVVEQAGHVGDVARVPAGGGAGRGGHEGGEPAIVLPEIGKRRGIGHVHAGAVEVLEQDVGLEPAGGRVYQQGFARGGGRGDVQDLRLSQRVARDGLGHAVGGQALVGGRVEPGQVGVGVGGGRDVLGHVEAVGGGVSGVVLHIGRARGVVVHAQSERLVRQVVDRAGGCGILLVAPPGVRVAREAAAQMVGVPHVGKDGGGGGARHAVALGQLARVVEPGIIPGHGARKGDGRGGPRGGGDHQVPAAVGRAAVGQAVVESRPHEHRGLAQGELAQVDAAGEHVVKHHAHDAAVGRQLAHLPIGDVNRDQRHVALEHAGHRGHGVDLPGVERARIHELLVALEHAAHVLDLGGVPALEGGNVGELVHVLEHGGHADYVGGVGEGRGPAGQQVD